MTAVTMRTALLASLLALVGCSRGDQEPASTARAAPSATAPRGPDHLVLRVPRTGGEARVYAYPRLDTVVWRAPSAPAPARVMAFDDEAGSIAFVDAKGAPARIDFRQGIATTVTKAKLGFRCRRCRRGRGGRGGGCRGRSWGGVGLGFWG